MAHVRPIGRGRMSERAAARVEAALLAPWHVAVRQAQFTERAARKAQWTARSAAAQTGPARTGAGG